MYADYKRTKRCVNHYRRLGLCPLPSRMDRKGPSLPTYTAHYSGTPVPESVYANWNTSNVQLICGTKSPTPTKIIVVDCDGPEAIEVWGRICHANNYVQVAGWTAITGSGGRHHYFLIADKLSAVSGLLWGCWDSWGDDGKGKWVKHKEIRILGDSSLVVAPPSIHVDTGKRYEFTGFQNPNRVKLPAPAPDWLLAMPRLSNPRCGEPAPTKSEYVPRVSVSGRYYTRDEVLAEIGDRKFEIAKEWGLVAVSEEPNPNGWVCCYVPGREDPGYSRPSGSFNWKDGTLQDRKTMETMTFFDLGVTLHKFNDWQECRDALGDKFIGRIVKKRRYPIIPT